MDENLLRLEAYLGMDSLGDWAGTDDSRFLTLGLGIGFERDLFDDLFLHGHVVEPSE